ncbi:MAG: tlca3 [Chlamydiia bacterium]|nr:tlca3 [Chlamydiia bacterium]
MAQDVKPEFSKWRAIFWPVHGYELKKVLPMFLMFFFISFNYTILRDTKDTLVVTSKAGAEAIPFLKFWGTLPAAVIFMLIYSKMSNMLTKENLFYATIAPFLIFFGLFATVFYPNRDALQLDTLANFLTTALPEGAHGLVESIRAWHYSVFYILSELWGSAVLSLLFWQFANDITKVSEAKRVYALFAIGANLALIVSGEAIVRVSDIRRFLPPDVDAWQQTLNWLMGMIVVAGVGTVAVYAWINRNVLTDARFYSPAELKAKKPKTKMSIGESFMFLARSPYILCLATIVIAYGISINLVEVTWKKQVGLQFPNANDYSTFMGRFSQTTGIVTILMSLFVGANAIRKGWGFAALITPVVLLITGAGFFSFIIWRDSLGALIASFGMTPLWMAVVFGWAQNVMSKSAKYTLFDPTKEMAYIPLDPESKVKGKAAIDVVGARLGKSGGSLIQQVLMLTCGSLAAITPYIAVILFAIIAVWIIAVLMLDKKFTALTAVKPSETTKVEIVSG